jgi:hypothetical protein
MSHPCTGNTRTRKPQVPEYMDRVSSFESDKEYEARQSGNKSVPGNPELPQKSVFHSKMTKRITTQWLVKIRELTLYGDKG